MQLKKLVLVGLALAPVLSTVEPAEADDGVALASAPIVRMAAPAALDPQKRTLKLAAAIKALGVAQSPPQTLDVRLTPMTPRASGGAAITRAGTVVFNGADTDEPDGSYALSRGAGSIALASVEMRVPTEKGKLYVVDCRLRVPQGAATKFALTRGGTTSVVTVEDGHVLTAFTATATTSPLVVSATPGPGDTSGVLAHFYGCDIGKAN